ncbi:MAG: DUF4298 domain-containing protein [Oscillospiraceae bacterium]|nr:DUF4298 domain-containing protein [Oscillospiraceae bacterium]
MRAMQEGESLRILRIEQMERLFDEVNAGCEDASEKIQVLTEYYDSGLWLSDYEADERGLLPKDLKRGVLSQDGLYDLLSKI